MLHFEFTGPDFQVRWYLALILINHVDHCRFNSNQTLFTNILIVNLFFGLINWFFDEFYFHYLFQQIFARDHRFDLWIRISVNLNLMPGLRHILFNSLLIFTEN